MSWVFGNLQRAAEWWFQPVSRGRIAALRTMLYLFIFVDVLLTTAWVAAHGLVPGELYEPLLIGRLLPLPVPGPVLVPVVEIMLLIAAGIGATGRWPRAAGIAVAFLYFQWMVIAFSYGKVDHDRIAFLVALAVLPTAGSARWGDRTRDEACGWAVRAIQVAVVLTYFLAAFAKFRFGGFDWASGATLMRSVIRRGTGFGDLFIDWPWALTATQWFIIVFELASPLLLVPGRVGRAMLTVCLVFHAVTFATITIVFLPHIVCLLAFMPLEKLASERSFERTLANREQSVGLP